MPYRSGKLLVVALSLLGLIGCTPTPPRNTVNVIGDKFSKSITLEGIPLLNPNNGDLFWMLRSEVNPQAHFALHQIYVEWTYAGPSSGRYFAADDTARPLPVKNIRRESCPFNKCDRTDTLGIGIDEATLRARASTGFQVKLSAQDGTAGILDITPKMINAQLAAEDAVFSSGGPPRKAFLGIGPMDLMFGAGVMVDHVDPGTPAAAAGFQIGDMIRVYDGHPIKKAQEVRDLIAQTPPGKKVSIEIDRHGTHMTLVAQM
jgi:hypothetical protein